MNNSKTDRAAASEEYTIKRDQYQNCKSISCYLCKRIYTAEDRSVYIHSIESSLCIDTENQTVTAHKAIIDSRSDTTSSNLYILKKPHPCRATDRVKDTAAGEYSRKYRETILQYNSETKEEILEQVSGQQ